uniref:Lipoprotein n=1 Tax=Utricularia reniformis TaxID=192314 RepID=A0A1Y0B397_9LAMI|nr:hypothetical protein AEK19_MT1738 [Utricularia reniformis]ART31915.1 hypothetical protein AEK19_MT1738 [Utricularia reniformis]
MRERAVRFLSVLSLLSLTGCHGSVAPLTCPKSIPRSKKE